MRIPAGRIIRVDMGDRGWGTVLYLVIQPPIICQTCNSVIFEWRQSDEGTICPACENVIQERNYYPCPECGGMDYHTLRVINNNNWGYDSVTGQITQYNDKKGTVLNVCGKSLVNDIKHQNIVLMNSRQSQDIKRKIVWTSSMDYDPSKPMPQQIIDRFPYDEQE